MDKDIFRDRAQGEESAYFRQQDARLLERLRQGAKLDDIAVALRDKLEIDKPDLLLRARELGDRLEPRVRNDAWGGCVAPPHVSRVVRTARRERERREDDRATQFS